MRADLAFFCGLPGGCRSLVAGLACVVFGARTVLSGWHSARAGRFRTGTSWERGVLSARWGGCAAGPGWRCRRRR